MAGFREFVTGEVLTAANVDDFLAKQAVMKFADSAARDTALGTAVGGGNALREGMVAYLDDTDEVISFDGTAWSRVGGRILQVVRATDTTLRSTTSTSYQDAGISVTITPTSSTSRLIIAYIAYTQVNAGTTGDQRYDIRITDSSNNALSGAEGQVLGVDFATTITSVADNVSLWGYVEPASTSALTYKVRFKSRNASNLAVIVNTVLRGQLYAIEVAA